MVNLSAARNLGRVAAGAALTLTFAVGAVPVSADTDLGHHGTVGAHSLSDTPSSPGATCNYHYRSFADRGKLVEIDVQPPNVRAVSGKSAQTVGWKFAVQRRVQGEGGAYPWKHRYTSPEMTAVTDDSHDATFTAASVPVKTGPNEAGGYYEYRVLVTMVWHRGDGSVQGTARDRVDYYRRHLDTGGSNTENGHCDAWVKFS